MTERLRPSLALLLGVLAVVSSACGSSEAETSAPTTTAPESTTSLAADEKQSDESAALPDGWLDRVIAVVDELHADRRAASELYTTVRVAGPAEFDATLALFDSDGASARAAAAAMPGQPGEATVDGPYLELVAATEALAADAERITSGLRDDEEVIRLALEDVDPAGGSSAEIVAAIGDHADFFEAWTRACFDLQASLGDEVGPPIDCIGLERSEPEATAASEVDPALVRVTVECGRGDGLDELGFDTSPYPWIDSVDRDANWIRDVVVIENRSDRHLQVDPGFRVQYLDERDELIAERDWLENSAPSLHAAPGQTVYRTGYAFEGVTFTLGLRGEDLPAVLLDNVFNRLDSCVVVGDPSFTASDENPHLDTRLVPFIEVACAELDPAGFYFSEVTISAPVDEDLWVEIGVEYLDADGNRQGYGGSREGPARVDAGETITRVGDSVAYTINDPAAVTDCRLHSARSLP